MSEASPAVASGSAMLVIPCYNERARLGTRALVDDGSTDGTADHLDAHDAQAGRVGLLQLASNSGKAEAVRTGVLEALDGGAGFAGYWDADLAVPLDVAPEFLAYVEDHDRAIGVLGSRVKLLRRTTDRKTVRHYVGRVSRRGPPSPSTSRSSLDTRCGAKLFRATPLLRRAFSEPFEHRWLFDVEIARVDRGSEPSAEEMLFEWPLMVYRGTGQSKVRLRDGLRAAWVLVRWWLRRVRGLRA